MSLNHLTYKQVSQALKCLLQSKGAGAPEEWRRNTRRGPPESQNVLMVDSRHFGLPPACPCSPSLESSLKRPWERWPAPIFYATPSSRPLALFTSLECKYAFYSVSCVWCCDLEVTHRGTGMEVVLIRQGLPVCRHSLRRDSCCFFLLQQILQEELSCGDWGRQSSSGHLTLGCPNLSAWGPIPFF